MYHESVTPREVRDLIVEALRDNPQVAPIFPIGNAIHLFVEGAEFEVVVKTMKADRVWPARGPYNTGPLAQE